MKVSAGNDSFWIHWNYLAVNDSCQIYWKYLALNDSSQIKQMLSAVWDGFWIQWKLPAVYYSCQIQFKSLDVIDSRESKWKSFLIKNFPKMAKFFFATKKSNKTCTFLLLFKFQHVFFYSSFIKTHIFQLFFLLHKVAPIFVLLIKIIKCSVIKKKSLKNKQYLDKDIHKKFMKEKVFFVFFMHLQGSTNVL